MMGFARTALAAAAALAVASLVGAGTLGSPRSAHACSAGPDFDPLEGLEVIASGFVVDVALVAKRVEASFIVVKITLDVDRYLLGTGSTALALTDSRSARPLKIVRDAEEFEALDLATVSIDDLLWDGSGGACGAINGDPRGQYWVVGATRSPDGALAISGPSLFAIGIGPEDPRVRERTEFVGGLVASAGLGPAATGNLGTGAPTAVNSDSPAMLLTAVLVATAALRVPPRRRRQ